MRRYRKCIQRRKKGRRVVDGPGEGGGGGRCKGEKRKMKREEEATEREMGGGVRARIKDEG